MPAPPHRLWAPAAGAPPAFGPLSPSAPCASPVFLASCLSLNFSVDSSLKPRVLRFSAVSWTPPA